MSEGYLGNSHLKKSNQDIEWTPDLIKEYMKCAQDPIYFAEKYIHIVNIDRGLVLIDLYDFQKDIIDSITNNRRVVVNSSRQAGKTTTAVAIILHYVLFNEYKTVALLANKGDTAREILSRVQIAYESLPKWLQQGVIEWNKGSIELENGCKVIAASSSSSSIRGKSCVTGDTRVCVEDQDDYYFVEIEKVINNMHNRNIDKAAYHTAYRVTNLVNNQQYIGFRAIKSPRDLRCEKSKNGSIYQNGYIGSGNSIREALKQYGPMNIMQELVLITENERCVQNMRETMICENWVKK